MSICSYPTWKFRYCIEKFELKRRFQLQVEFDLSVEFIRVKLEHVAPSGGTLSKPLKTSPTSNQASCLVVKDDHIYYAPRQGLPKKKKSLIANTYLTLFRKIIRSKFTQNLSPLILYN